jgi:hypothetical protein
MDRLSKTKLKASELEAVIMKRICQEPKCAGIIQVYIKATGREPPEDTWTHTLVSRRTNVPQATAETSAMNSLLNDLRQEFDLIPD